MLTLHIMNEALINSVNFSYFKGVGPVNFKALLSYFKTHKNLYNASISELKECLGSSLYEKFVVFKNKFNAESEILRLKKENIEVIDQTSPHYPRLLLEITDPPICLYVKGSCESLNLNKTYFAVVGTRKPTSYGEYVTRKITSELARSNFVIVSGLAIGIDAISHSASVAEKAVTVAVLGCGVNIIYPKENYLLYEEIIRNNGAVVSEFPPDTTTIKGYFVARNRVISGISGGVLVVEGLKNSGSLITARYALNQGREVFAPPCPINSPYSFVPNLLLKEGAKLTTCANDILQEFGEMLNTNDNCDPYKNLNLTSDLLDIIKTLKEEPLTSDELALKLNLTISLALSKITTCEILGVLRKNKTGRYEVIR